MIAKSIRQRKCAFGFVLNRYLFVEQFLPQFSHWLYDYLWREQTPRHKHSISVLNRKGTLQLHLVHSPTVLCSALRLQLDPNEQICVCT